MNKTKIVIGLKGGQAQAMAKANKTMQKPKALHRFWTNTQIQKYTQIHRLTDTIAVTLTATARVTFTLIQ